MINITGPHIEEIPAEESGERTINVLFVQPDERTVTEAVLEVLIDDEDKGNLSKVAYVLVSIEYFVYLVAEDTIQGYHLSRSTTEEPFILTIPDVQFGKYKFPVKVGSNEVLSQLIRGRMATMTKDNTVA